MKFLGFLIGGIILGYLWGLHAGETKAVEDSGFFSFFFLDEYKAHYGNRGALLGGITGAIFGLFIQLSDGNKKDRN